MIRNTAEVAKRMYKKRLSRDVAVKGAACMTKIVGAGRDQHTEGLAASIRELNGEEQRNTSDDQLPCSSASSQTIQDDEMADQTDQADPNDGMILPAPEGNNVVVNTSDHGQLPCASSSPRSIQGDGTADQTDETNSPESNPLGSPIKIDDADDLDAIASTSCTNRVPATPIPIISVTPLHLSTVADDPTSYDVAIKKEELSKLPRKMQFTSTEDTFIKSGVKKYGLGKWVQILRDDSYKFHPCRTRDAIRMRACTLGISKKKRDSKRKAV